jgi:hypothetical protein
MGERHEASLARVAKEQHGVFHLRQWLSLGLSASTLSRRVRSGLIERLGSEVYCYSGVPPTWQWRCQPQYWDQAVEPLPHIERRHIFMDWQVGPT